MTMGELIDEYGWPPSMWPEEYRPKDKRILLLQEIRQEINKAIDCIPITFSRNDADDCLKRDIKDIFDKHIKEIEGSDKE